MRRVVPLLIVLCLGFAPAPVYKPRLAESEELARLRGEWVMVEETFGQTAPLTRDLSSGAYQVVFSGCSADVRMEGRVYRWQVALDPATSPKTMEKYSRAKDGEFLQMKCAYSLEGDTLILCYDRAKWSVRPDDLAGKGKLHHRQVFKRRK